MSKKKMEEPEVMTKGISRREFVKGAAVGAVGVGVVTSSLGLIGCGPQEVSELPENWDEEADVVIVGSGFAGLAAAVEAANAGSSVKVIEKMDMVGGNSKINGGAIVVAGAPLQAEEGIKDSADLLYEDMMKAGLHMNHPDLARQAADKTMETLNWTIALGVEYKSAMVQFGGHSVKRSYATTQGHGWGIVEKELVRAEELGVEVKTNRFLTKLFRDKDGRVKGVEIRDGYKFPDETSGEVKNIKVKKAVVMASGGFSGDLRMRTIQDPRLTDELDCTNQAGATGEAMREAFRIGANAVQPSWIQLGPWASPDEKGFGFIPGFGLLSKAYGMQFDPETGKRFMNELGSRKECADAILKVGHPVICMADSLGSAICFMAFAEWMEGALENGSLHKFDTIDELISFYNINAKGFKEELKRYNSFVEKGVDEDFGKDIVKGAKQIGEPPFYAARLWPKVHHCMGGIQIDLKMHAIDLKGNVIKGLYAAGEVSGGVHGACRLGSCATSECLTNGRIAGKNAAKEKPWE